MPEEDMEEKRYQVTFVLETAQTDMGTIELMLRRALDMMPETPYAGYLDLTIEPEDA